jgi:5-methylcytosine-specific restriction protein A
MTIELETLENIYQNFVESASKETVSFDLLDYINITKNEGYKHSIFSEARENLNSKFWRVEDIGTGQIKEKVASAIQTKVYHEPTLSFVDNNLVNWRQIDEFTKRANRKSLEITLFNFYKNKTKDNESFEALLKEKLSYQFVAYLFFIKVPTRYMPISQETFDKVFKLLGIGEFKTSHNASWDNYLIYNDIIKQTQIFLQTKDKNTTLLDAHSFLFILSYKHESLQANHTSKIVIPQKEQEEKLVHKEYSTVTELKNDEWIEILQDRELTNELDLSILQTLYLFSGHKAYASQIALKLGRLHSELNLEIGRYAKRIATKHNVKFTARNPQQDKYWDLFFDGWEDGIKFVWRLKSELTIALEKLEFVKDTVYPDDLPHNYTGELLEGVKQTVEVNKYERNPTARKLCVEHWGAVCSVCKFNFEKIYGEIGRGFIHVHHLTPIFSKVGVEYEIDPVNDLRPVCPNCHAMLHKIEPPFTIDELKKIMNL